MPREIQRTGICAVTIIVAVIVNAYILTTYLGINTAPGVILVVTIVSLYALVRGAAKVMVKGTPTHLLVARPRDHSQIQRVVYDTMTRQEYIISGTHSQSFRSACKDDWVFRSMGANGDWIIQDERGNDISALSLSEYHGIAKLVSMEPTKTPSSYYDAIDENSDKSDEYSDMERGVTFYD